MQRILLGLVVLLAGGLAVMVWQHLSLLAAARATEQQLADARQLLALEVTQRRRLDAAAANGGGRDATAAAVARTRLSPPAAEPVTVDAAQWRARFAQRPLDAAHAAALARQLARLPAAEGLRLVSELWQGLSGVARRATLAAFAEVEHEHLLDVLDLGARDPRVRDHAFDLLRGLALRDFRDDPSAYATWRAATKGLTRAEVIAVSARPLALRLQAMTAVEAIALLEELGLESAMRGDADLAGALRESGALGMVEGWLRDGPSRRAFAIADAMGADEVWLQANVLPYAADPAGDPAMRAAACAAISRPGASWAVPVVGEFARGYLRGLAPASVTVGSADASLIRSIRGLVEVGDPRAIPLLIAMIRDDQSGAAIYNVGHFGLAELTGVRFDESHDGPWWVQWWYDNQQHLPAAIRGMALPE